MSKIKVIKVRDGKETFLSLLKRNVVAFNKKNKFKKKATETIRFIGVRWAI
jgi:hypothetical protein